ncbi:helix-turn-helix domain-containing protein [Spirillospora sp. NPDC127200]
MQRWKTKDVAEYLNVSEGTVLRWRRQGDMPEALGKNGKQYEWDAAAVKKWAREWFPHLREHVGLDLDAAWWGISEVATYLMVDAVSVQRYHSQGRMPAPDRRVGRSPAWRPQTIIAWAKTRPRYTWKDPASKHPKDDAGAAAEGMAQRTVKAGQSKRPRNKRAEVRPDAGADELWGYSEIAAHMGVSVGTVREYKKELGEPERYFGRSPVWRKGAVLEWISSRPAAGWNGERPGRRPARVG